MTDSTRSYSARDRGKLARRRCAGAPRYGGLRWGRDDKRLRIFSGLRERHFFIGCDVEDGGDCSVTTYKDAPLEPANARSMVMRSPFSNRTNGTATRGTLVRRWQFQVRSRPGPQLRRVIPGTSTRERRRRFRTGVTDASCH